jgi:hypothetical protein
MPSLPDSVHSSSSSSSFSSFAGSRSWALAGALALASALALAVALLAAVVPAAHAARVAKAQAAKVTLTKLTVADFKLTIAGRVSLPPVSASTARLRKLKSTSQRQHTEVYLTLTNGAEFGGKNLASERFAVKLNGKDQFTVTHTTKLTGALGLSVLVKIDGKQSGKKISRTLQVSVSGVSGAGSIGTSGTGSTGSTTPGSTTPGSPGSPSSPGTTAPTGTTLIGTFEIEAGVEHPDGLISGTYFRMQHVGNENSPFGDKEYTPLSPGVDGGLETFAYQEPPVPAFANGDLGGALANEIVQPQTFFNVNFSIATAPTDLQEGLPDPLPQIVDTEGKLSGQITAWDAQWNGSSFNQGAPKANGTFPGDGYGVTTLPTGTYDAATGHYVLTWTSVIVGPPFAGFIGEWHLEGTFVPQA